MEHVHPVNRPFSWRGLALALGLVLVVVLAGFGGMALLHRLGQAHPVPSARHTAKNVAAIRLRPRSGISVLVLNGDGINGAAGGVATRLLADGYRHAIPTDAGSTAYATSLVLFRPGWENEARRLAKDAHIAAIAPLDGRVAAAYERVQLVVILGG